MKPGRVALNMQMVVNLDHPQVAEHIQVAKHLIIDAVRYWAQQSDEEICGAMLVDDQGSLQFDDRCFVDDGDGLWDQLPEWLWHWVEDEEVKQWRAGSLTPEQIYDQAMRRRDEENYREQEQQGS